MNQYKYLALDQNGQEVLGTIASQDRQSAISNLSQQGCFVKEIDLDDQPSTSSLELKLSLSSQVKSKDILNLINQLSVALKSGLPLLSALEVILEQEQKSANRELLQSLIEDVNKGEALSQAMSKHPDHFRSIATSMIEAGEVGGILDQTCEKLSVLLKREEQIKNKIKTALAYPMFVLIIGIVSVVFIITTILPNVIGAMGSEILLPWPTKALLAINDLLSQYGLFIFIALTGLIAFRKKLAQQLNLKEHLDRLSLKTPLVGKMITEIAIGRFARTVGSLGQGGITILQSLSIVKSSLGNLVLERAMEHIEEKVKTGIPLSQALKESNQFPPLLIQVVSMGEKTGELDQLLLNAADTFEEQADAMIQKCMNLLPGLLMVILFIIIGFITLAILLPIMGMDLAPSGF